MASSVCQVVYSETEPWLRIDKRSETEPIISNSRIHHSAEKYKILKYILRGGHDSRPWDGGGASKDRDQEKGSYFQRKTQTLLKG